MKTDGGWISVSEAARLYGKSRKWVYDQLSAYGLETQKEGNRTRLRLVDLIAHRGEPQASAPAHTETQTENSQKITPEKDLLSQENQFLRERINALEADQSERQAREARWKMNGHGSKGLSRGTPTPCPQLSRPVGLFRASGSGFDRENLPISTRKCDPLKRRIMLRKLWKILWIGTLGSIAFIVIVAVLVSIFVPEEELEKTSASTKTAAPPEPPLEEQVTELPPPLIEYKTVDWTRTPEEQGLKVGDWIVARGHPGGFSGALRVKKGETTIYST